MIVPDVNLLLYAYDASSPFHAKASAWLSASLSGTEVIGLYPPVLFAFVRIGTSPQAFVRPLPVGDALGHVESWLGQACVQIVDMDAADVRSVCALLRAAGAGRNLTSDAQLAALALRHDAMVHTADSDFARFPKVRWHNPILA